MVAIVLAFVGPWGVGHFHLGRRARGTTWLAAATFGLMLLGCLVPMMGDRVGWGVAVLVPFAWMLVVWVASLSDLFITKDAARAAPLWQTLLFFVGGIAGPLLASLVIRIVALEPYVVPTESMQPTVLVGDHLFATRLDRRARYGDVVVVVSPEHPDQMLVKRVIGRPDDVLEMRSGRPFVNGWQVPSCVLGNVRLGEGSGELEVEFLGNASYLVFYDASRPEMAHAGPFYAAADGLLVLGDDRNDSADSRTWHRGLDGNVHASALRGRALFVWLRGSPVDARTFGIDLGHVDLPSSLTHLRPALERCLAARPSAWPPASFRH